MRSFKMRISRSSRLFYLIPLFPIAIALILSAFYIRKSIEYFLVDQMAEHSKHISINYMNRLANSVEASDVIKDLNDQKLRVAGRALANTYTAAHTEDLVQMAEKYEIDVIYIFNQYGTVIDSINDEAVGWKTHSGHPVHDFMISDEQLIVEDIRQDTETKRYYKYAYTKTEDGCIIQLGIAADRIISITEKFTMDYYINALGEEELAQNVFFIEPDGILAASSSASNQTLTLTNDELLAVRSQTPLERRVTYEGKEYYRSLVPVFVSDRYSGALIIDNDLAEHNKIIKIVYMTIFGIALVIFIVLSIFSILIVSRNRQLIRYAYFDTLTGLPNMLCMKESPNILASIKAGKGAILMLNIVNFRKFNMIAGRDIGDAVLKQLAQKLRSHLPDEDSLFRLSEDRFIICRYSSLDDDELYALCDRLEQLSRISYSSISEELQAFRSESDETISVKIGILKLSDAHRDIESVIKDLEILIEYLKSQTTITHGFFNQTMRSALEESELIKKTLKDVLVSNNNIANASLVTLFQPQFGLANGKAYRFEALSRLYINEVGFISPLRFIEIAEKNQLIVDLGHYVLVKACEFLIELEHNGFSNQVIAINVSAIELFQNNFAANMLRTIRRFGLSPEQIEIEITETNLISNYAIIYDELKRLNNHGIKIAIDDFGTGYSSLSRLGTLPVDCIKIDKYFIDGLSENSFSLFMVEAIINISHKLNIAVVAEGVETKDQRETLINLDCDYIQGYYYSKPVTGNEIISLLQNNHLEDA